MDVDALGAVLVELRTFAEAIAPAVFSVEQVARMLSCSVESVELQARNGNLPGLKFGRQWTFPAYALVERLNEIAAQEAAERRAPRKTYIASTPINTVALVQPFSRKSNPRARPRPVLPEAHEWEQIDAMLAGVKKLSAPAQRFFWTQAPVLQSS